MLSPELLFFGLSSIVTLLFFLYGFNHYFLLSAAFRYKTPGLPVDAMADKPRVVIHLPVYNEKYVIHRLVSACASMAENYGIDRVKIVIIDDSDDETVQVIDQEIADYRAKQIDIEVLRRLNRQVDSHPRFAGRWVARQLRRLVTQGSTQQVVVIEPVQEEKECECK